MLNALQDFSYYYCAHTTNEETSFRVLTKLDQNLIVEGQHLLRGYYQPGTGSEAFETLRLILFSPFYTGGN